MVRLGLTLLLLAGRGAAAATPDDARLNPARAQLETVFAAAARDGVPESILSDKVKEGLAKGVPAARIALVVRTLEQSLADGARQAAPRFSPPPPSLLKAMVAARAAGAQPRELEALLNAGAQLGASTVTRALDVLTDLAQRGFPTAAAARAVAAVESKSPRELERISPQAQSLSSKGGLARAEALDAIARAAKQGLGVDRAAEATGHDPPGLENKDRGPNRESSGQRGPGNGKANGHP
jgi:hypothetical protein